MVIYHHYIIIEIFCTWFAMSCPHYVNSILRFGQWADMESLIRELQQNKGIQSVSKGRFFLSPGLAPTFQVRRPRSPKRMQW